MDMKILISGGTGFVGRKLVEELKNKHKLFVLTRDPIKAEKILGENIIFLKWDDVYQQIDLASHGTMDAVINLVGENIGDKKWSNEQKKLLFNTRVDATKTIISSIQSSQGTVKHFISTSAVGIYTDGFLKKLCIAWEEAVTEFGKDIIERSVILRTGMVLGKGGAVEKMLKAFKMGVGGKIGDGQQWMCWIHRYDLVKAYEFCLDNKDVKGVVNAVSPFPVRNDEFTEVLGKVLRKPTVFTIPKFALKLIFGEMSALMLDSIRVEPKVLKESRFHYLNPTIELALKDVVSKS
jgi:uncharacterized protein (TIGR01777 family)